jgi:hypothetical protein
MLPHVNSTVSVPVDIRHRMITFDLNVISQVSCPGAMIINDQLGAQSAILIKGFSISVSIFHLYMVYENIWLRTGGTNLFDHYLNLSTGIGEQFFDSLLGEQ